MNELIAHCAGLDVHKSLIVACARRRAEDGELTEVIARFGTNTEDLMALRQWLLHHRVTHVAMESTGVYWKAPYYVLEGEFTTLLVNARYVKHLPGRKSDQIDCQWLAQLLSVGLLRASFVPPPEIRVLRDLSRYRKTLVRDRTREINRLHKVLEDAGIKLAAVATDIMGASGRLMLAAMVEGERDPEVLAELAKGRLRAKLPQLASALRGNVNQHHRFLLARMLARIDDLDSDIAAISAQVAEATRPFWPALTILSSITGVKTTTAEVVLAEIGADMSVFPSEKHISSWAKLTPGKHQSANKERHVGIGSGNQWLRTALLEAAWAASHTNDTYLSEFFHQIRRRSGRKVAIVAVAHEILVIAYRLLSAGELYRDPGRETLRHITVEQAKKRAIKQLNALGFEVEVKPAA